MLDANDDKDLFSCIQLPPSLIEVRLEVVEGSNDNYLIYKVKLVLKKYKTIISYIYKLITKYLIK